MGKLLLVDGHNLLFKAFYGIPEKLLSNGRPIHGVIGFISIITKIVKVTEPTHILVVFDPEEKPSRATLYPHYKENRQQDFGGKPDRENPFSQLADIKRALDCLHIKYVEQTGYEADDMIASYASQVPCKIVIVSSDTDFLQLVNKRTTMLRYHRKKSLSFNEAVVQEKYGIHPSRFLEYKALIGDKTDNIGGIKGIGPKNAIKVLNGERELMEEERRLFERNHSLIKLNTRVELPYTLNQLSFANKFEDFKAFEFLQNIGVLDGR
jgi:DNA polymerase-1